VCVSVCVCVCVSSCRVRLPGKYVVPRIVNNCKLTVGKHSCDVTCMRNAGDKKLPMLMKYSCFRLIVACIVEWNSILRSVKVIPEMYTEIHQ
jgi:hypothetical protein